MSASDEWEEWHLTKNGWVLGTEKTDFKLTQATPPKNRVATYKYREYLPNKFGRMIFSWELIFLSDQQKHTIEELKTKHGEFPNERIRESCALAN